MLNKTWQELIIKEYNVTPLLGNTLTNDEINAILNDYTSLDYGTSTTCLVCSDKVYYITKCPTKYAYSLICDQFPNCALQVKPVGNYDGFNIFVANKVVMLDNVNLSTQPTELIKFIMQNGKDNSYPEILAFCEALKAKLKELLPDVKCYLDFEFFNFGLHNGQLIAVDPIIAISKS